MEQPGDTEALRDRLSRLSEASLRINESLDPDTVLQEVMDNARALTGARFGAITTLDDEGGLLDFITSGLSPEEREVMLALTEGPRLFEYFSSVQGPLRLRDAAEHTRALGFPEGQPPVGSLMGTPMRHQGEHVGNLYVAEKEGGGEFTPEDEETLVMFASQAALVVSNARRYRDERRARTGLEALVNTSPVGVLVFDAGTGALTSINREARRIVSGLCMPGGSAEQLLEVLSFRRADGREVSLEEFPLAQALSTGEAVRAEEIVIQAPDGRSVATLVNATPIRSEEGEVESPVESVVVTLQDLTPLEEMERLRAEFLGMVSHELRTPLSTIKGSATTLLEAASDLDPAEMLQFFRIINQQADYMRDLIGDLLDVARIETGTLPVAAGIVEVAALVDEARNMFLRGGGRDNIRTDLPPDLPLVMADRRRIAQVLNNLLSNASRSSPESSAIRVSAVVADSTLRSPSPTTAWAFRPSACPACSGSSPRWRATRGGAISKGRAWAWPSARGSWRPTGAASGPRATGRDWAPASPSPYRWPRRAGPARRPDPLSPPLACGRGRGSSSAFSWWTTTRRRCGTSGTPSRKRATPRW